ncbi:restriction endonuclease subunit S [Aquabacterium soli]|uniref:Restriction endonuclease subunit S n=2 Tax=Aquabacterium soli TaxID=2493092 RepID=A0A3R8TSM0_9BURK|nr:restriction endonuclease subunit S [Aquabacterium soli]RRS03950.1 restriction endonuclease subunit S [Aquabacterium soli]
MLPDGWKASTVGRSCSIKNSLRFPINSTDRQQQRGPYPYFGPTGVLDFLDHYRIDEPIALIGEDGDHFLKFKERQMTLFHDGKSNVNNHAHVIGDSEECLAKWFYYYYMHRDLTPVLSRQGVGRYKLTKAGLEELEILVPPINEQRQAIELLDVWGAAISSTEKLLENSWKQKKALMQALLPNSVDQQEILSLHAISERIQRTSDGAKHPVLMISSGAGFVRQNEKYSRFMAGKSLNDYVLLKRGEFAYNKGNSKLYEFGCIFPLEDYEQGLVPHVYVCFKLDERCAPDYFKYLFEADYLHDQLGALVNTGVRNNGLLNIRPADFMNVTVPVPSMARQKYIADVLTAASSEIKLLQKDLDALRLQKRALMADLLTGKRRIRMPQSTAQREAA